jgi:alanine dehydrogenase
VANVGWRRAAKTDPSLAAGVNAVGGVLTNSSVAEAHGLVAVPLEELL